MVYVVALTGNIACGKTSAASMFAALGIDTINADEIAKQLTVKNTFVYAEIVKRYGKGVLKDNEEINRQQLRTIIFSNSKERQWLESILHPIIRQNITIQIQQASSPYCIAEIPLALNKDHYPYLNKILVITSPMSLQIARIIERDKCTISEAQKIIETQPSIEERLEYADHVLINNSNLLELKENIYYLHLYYLNKAGAHGSPLLHDRKKY